MNDRFAQERMVLARKKGVKQAFTSLHIPEEAGDLANRARSLLHIAKELGIEVFADVSCKTPEHLGLESLEELKSLGVTGIRLDDFFDKERILQLSKEFCIALNASIMFEEDLETLLQAGLQPEQLIAWHNFYPRRETGLDDEFFNKQNELFKRYQIPIRAYIQGNGEKRGPLFEGLPTLEKHRDKSPFVAGLELFQAGISDVYIGDPDFSEDLLDQLINYDQKKIIPIRMINSSLEVGEYRLRPDFARDVLRLMDTRSSIEIIPENLEDRPIGTITMDNNRYGRYQGEVQITLCDLKADKRVNVIGEIFEEDLPLLSLIKPGYRIKLIE